MKAVLKLTLVGLELLTKEKENKLFLFLRQTRSIFRIPVVNKIPYSKSLHYTSQSIDTIFGLVNSSVEVQVIPRISSGVSYFYRYQSQFQQIRIMEVGGGMRQME